MGVLSDWQIKRDIKITPFAEGIKRDGVISYGCSSYGYDARLGYKFKVFKAYPCSTIDPKRFDQRMLEDVDLTPKECLYPERECGIQALTKSKCTNCQYNQKLHNYIDIPPHSFILGESQEHFDIPRDVLCIVVGKSTYARCGIIINVTPGEPEWPGYWTIEISNTTPLPARVYAGEGIMQCIFLRSDGLREGVHKSLEYLADELGTGRNKKDDGTTDHDAWSCKIWKAHEQVMNNLTDLPDTGTCRVSYADKKGKYYDQRGLTTPTVDRDNKPD